MSKARVSVFVVVAGMIVASLASSPAWAVLLKAADWQMNEPETSGPMLDESGNGNNGTPINLEDRTGSTYDFNGLTTPASRVVVPDADSLDPKANDITLTARVRVGEEGDGVDTHQMDDDSYDVVRKGFITTAGGDYKMEIKRTANPTIGRLHCFFRGTLPDGTDDSVARVARPDVVDGQWHTLRCEKKSDSVVATVDTGRPFTTTGSADSIDNASAVWVGAKTVTLTSRGVERGDDVFDGSMDFVSIDIDQPSAP